MQPPKDPSFHWDEDDEFDILVRESSARRQTDERNESFPLRRQRSTEPTTSDKEYEEYGSIPPRSTEPTASRRYTGSSSNQDYVPLTRRATAPSNLAIPPTLRRDNIPNRPATNSSTNAVSRVHWIVPVSIGMLVMATLWLVGIELEPWLLQLISNFSKNPIILSPTLLRSLIPAFIIAILSIIASIILLTSKRANKPDRNTIKNQSDLPDTTPSDPGNHIPSEDISASTRVPASRTRYRSPYEKRPAIPSTNSTSLIPSNEILRRSISSPSSEKTLPSKNTENLIYLHLRIVEDPVSAMNFATILSAFIDLHTKSWLVSQNRLGDLIEYTQTHDPRFTAEAGLIIEKITHNSPPDIKFNLELSPNSVSEALKTGIDAIVQAPLRKEEIKLENQAKMLDLKIKELEANSEHASSTQNLQIEAQKAKLEEQKTLLEIEKQQIEIERQRLELQEMRLEMERKRIDYALDAASKMVTVLRPDADPETREMLMRTLLPNLLQLGNSTGVEITLIAPEPKEKLPE